MDASSQTGPEGVQIGVADLAGPWQATIAGAPSCDVALPSHVPDVLAALVPGGPAPGELVDVLAAYLDGGGRLTLLHTVRSGTVTALPDLVRFVDDNLPGVDGIRYDCGPDLSPADLPGIQPWWQAAVAASRAREVGLEVADGAWLPAPPDMGLRPPATEPPDVEPENVWVFPLGHDATDAELISAVEDVSLPRYINPARIDLPEAEVEAHCVDEPRDAERIGRAYRPNPWVAVNLGLLDPSRPQDAGLPRLSLVHAVLTRCVIRRVLPHVVVAWEGDPGKVGRAALERLETLCDQHEVPFVPLDLSTAERVEEGGLDTPAWTFASAEGDPGSGALQFDFVLSVARLTDVPFRGSLAGGFGLLPSDLADRMLSGITDACTARFKGTASEPLSVWLGDYIQERFASEGLLTANAWAPALTDRPANRRLEPWLRAARRDGYRVDLGRASRPDLWILDAPGLNLLAASGDPFPIDRLALDALGQEPESVPYLGTASEQGYPYANHEGGRIEGRVADEVLMGPPRLPSAQPGKPLTILGVACTTLANHAACVVQDGVVVAAIQEERIRRRKQLGWHPPGRPEDTVVSDSALPLSRCQPRRSIQRVLEMAGLSMEDVDCIAYNGVPARWFPTYSLRDPHNPPRTVRFGREMFIPHHLTHAASAYRLSGMDQAFVFTVDGRGERETAAFFETDDRGALHRIFDIPCNEDSLIGGVYEFITTILGFGHFGQGSTMGLAAMGRPTMDVSRWLSARSRYDYSIHDTGIMEAFGHLTRERGSELKREHVELAASIQYALEEVVLNLIEDGLGGRPATNLCLAGGVALNCSMNQRIRAAFDVENIFVQPGAHDAGTAVGAALEAHWEITGERGVATMTNAYWGPGYSDERIEETLRAFHLPVDRRADIAGDVAELVADGEIVCWFQGRMEFGPRALGARSILADPRSVEVKDRVNRLKGRQKWRPFGPSILAGHEQEWFEMGFHSPFMLFTLPVKAEKQAEIPGVLHKDGTTRPQSVTEEDSPLYHACIRRFHELTGVPMVLNTSFNTHWEPIVCSPEDAIASFLDLSADALAMGPYLVRRDALGR